MYWLSEGELVGEVVRFRDNRDRAPWFWYRDVLLQCQERGYLRIIEVPNVPFWWRSFSESIELTPRLIELIDKVSARLGVTQ